ncbi:MAG: hypothetical protein WD055_03970 [Candidatus Dependentiae bacterium]
MKKLLIICTVFILNVYGGDPSPLRSGPRLAKSAPMIISINILLSQGENLGLINESGTLTLDLSNKGLNNLDGITLIPNIKEVERLRLTDNQLSSLEDLRPQLLKAIPNLKEIFLYRNKFSKDEKYKALNWFNNEPYVDLHF